MLLIIVVVAALASPLYGVTRTAMLAFHHTGSFLAAQEANARRTAMAAVKITKVAKGMANAPPTKLERPIDPRLRALVNDDTYRRAARMLNELEQQGLLDEFLMKARDFWSGVDFFEWAEKESKSSGMIYKLVRRDWPRIWPEKMESERMSAFEIFFGFWKRLDQSRSLERAMTDILPDLMEKEYQEYSFVTKDKGYLKSLNEEERTQEILRRLAKSETVAHYHMLTRDDADTQSVAGKMGPFIARILGMVENKVSSKGRLESPPGFEYLAGAFAFVIIGGFFLFDVVKLPTLSGPTDTEKAQELLGSIPWAASETLQTSQ